MLEGLEEEGVPDLRCGKGDSATVEKCRIKPAALGGCEHIGLNRNSLPASRSLKQDPRRQDVTTDLFSQEE